MDGKVGELKKDLTEKMLQASEAMEYEKAAHYRDSLQSLERLEEKQKATTEGGDRDVIAWLPTKPGSAFRCSLSGAARFWAGTAFPGPGSGGAGGDILSDL